MQDADGACQLVAAVGEGLAGDGDDFELGRESAPDFDDLGAGGVFEPEVENDEVDGALVLLEDLHALAGRVGFELALKRLARHRLRVDEQPMVRVGFAAMD